MCVGLKNHRTRPNWGTLPYKQALLCVTFVLFAVCDVSCAKRAVDASVAESESVKAIEDDGSCSLALNFGPEPNLQGWDTIWSSDYEREPDFSPYYYIRYSSDTPGGDLRVDDAKRGTVIQTGPARYALIDYDYVSFSPVNDSSLKIESWFFCDSVSVHPIANDMDVLMYTDRFLEQALRRRFPDIPKRVLPIPGEKRVNMNSGMENDYNWMGNIDKVQLGWGFQNVIDYTANQTIHMHKGLQFVHTLYDGDYVWYWFERRLVVSEDYYDPDLSDEQNKELIESNKKIEKTFLEDSLVSLLQRFKIGHDGNQYTVDKVDVVALSETYIDLKPQIDKAIEQYKKVYEVQSFQKGYPSWDVSVIPLYAFKDDAHPERGLTKGVRINITPRYAYMSGYPMHYAFSIPYEQLPPSIQKMVDANTQAPNGCGYIDWENQTVVLNKKRHPADLSQVIGVLWTESKAEIPAKCSPPYPRRKDHRVEDLSDVYSFTEDGSRKGYVREFGFPLREYDPGRYEYINCILQYCKVEDKTNGLMGVKHIRTDEWLIPLVAKSIMNTGVQPGRRGAFPFFVLQLDDAGLKALERHFGGKLTVIRDQPNPDYYLLNWVDIQDPRLHACEDWKCSSANHSEWIYLMPKMSSIGIEKLQNHEK